MPNQKIRLQFPEHRSLTARDLAWSACVALLWVLGSYLLVNLWLLPVPQIGVA